MFEYEIGNVRRNIDSQSGRRPTEDMKMIQLSSFGNPGSLIFVVVALGLKKHVFCSNGTPHAFVDPKVSK